MHSATVPAFIAMLNNIKGWEVIQKKLADAPQEAQDQWQSSLNTCQEELNFNAYKPPAMQVVSDGAAWSQLSMAQCGRLL